MRIVINLVLFLVCCFLAYLLYNSIWEPIAFQNVKEKRQGAVVERLKDVRKAQEMYRSITEEYAPNFDTLKQVLTEGKFAIISVFGDPDDPNFNGEIQYDTTFVAAIDSVNTLGLNLDSLQYIPYGEGKTFDILADTLTYQSTLVHVCEVGTPMSTFMGDYSDARFKRYDNNYNPSKVIKFGDMNKPNLSGSWDR